jgi:CheY-like chemotaxis protein
MKTIFVVDDEPGIAEVLSALLDDEGYRVFTAANGRQALARLAEFKPDLLLIDYMMPIMDGAGLIAALQDDAALRLLPCVLMSGVPETLVRKRCSGYAGFLRKPFDAETLLKEIRRLIGTAR